MAAAAPKPWRDWIYLVTILPMLLGMLSLDFVAFYPHFLYKAPGTPLHFLLSLRDRYVASTGDPFFASSSVAHEPWFQAFLYIELLFQFPLSTYLVLHWGSNPKRSTSGAAELAGLAFGCVTCVGSVVCCFALWHMGPDAVRQDKKAQLLYGTYMPFAVIPGVLALDMWMRLLRRLRISEGKLKAN